MSEEKSEIKFHLEGPPPKDIGPHLIFYYASGMATAFPVGSMIGIVDNPKKQHPMQRMLVVKLHHDHWHFRCVCNPKCTVVWKYKMEESGRHG